MRKTLLVFPIVLGFIFFLSLTRHAYAEFNSAYLRLDNQTANSALSGTLCAQPSSAGAETESSISITFPNNFTISTNTSNWTTSTTNLPTGATAWPTISANATAISGKTVTFSSSDLNADTVYCFHFNASSSTTGATGDGQIGTITSKNASNITIDSTVYAISIVTNNQIVVSASIDPKVADLPISIEATTTGIQFPQDTTLSYKITYGTNTIGTVPLTIQAQWSQGTINGSPTPSVDILDYVIGSASNGYNNTSPVVDSVNRTITWTISSVPGGTTNQTVTFSLRTNSSYTGANNVSFDVAARTTSGSTVTPDTSVTQNYLYSVPVSTYNPGGPGSGVSDNLGCASRDCSGTTTTTATPSNQSASFIFNSINISSISKNEAKIFVTTNNSSTLTVLYGQSPSSLSQSVKTTIFATENTINLPNLSPDTDYYFRISAKDTSGNTIESDIFTFKTAIISESPVANLESLVVTSKNNILVNPTGSTEVGKAKNNIIIPKSSVFEIQFSLNKNISVKSIQAIVRNKTVLGVNTSNANEANSNFVNLVETSPGVYTGKLKSLPNPGYYEIYVRIIDFNGNITEQKIADLTITSKLTIFEKGTKNPVEGARVLLSLYNRKTRTYDIISPEILSIQNPIYSLPDGSLDLVLPIGQYKADISAIGYDSKEVEFAITSDLNSYPQIEIQKQPFNLINSINYYSEIFLDGVSVSQNYLRQQASSNRFFNFLTTIALFSFVFIVFLSFSAKSHISLLSLPYFFIYKLKLMFEKTKNSVIVGKIIEKGTENPVSKVNVYLIDAKLNKIIAHAKSDRLGDFYFDKPKIKSFKISAMKKGFLSGPFMEYENENVNLMPLSINLEKDEGHIKNLFDIWFIYAEDLFGVILEFLIVLSLVFEIFFISTFGFVRIAPYLILTTINFVLLFLFLYKPKKMSGKISLSYS